MTQTPMDWKEKFHDFYYMSGEYSSRPNGYQQYVSFIEYLLTTQREKDARIADKLTMPHPTKEGVIGLYQKESIADAIRRGDSK